MNIFRYIVLNNDILYKREEPLIDSKRAGFFISGEKSTQNIFLLKKRIIIGLNLIEKEIIKSCMFHLEIKMEFIILN